MKTSLTKGLTIEKQEEIASSFKASYLVRKRLAELLLEKVESYRTESRSKDRYKDANWAYYQADEVGYERAIFEVISLLE